jgi:outer membrane lipopolysaccharide assembly protein LptE/RlpB
MKLLSTALALAILAGCGTSFDKNIELAPELPAAALQQCLQENTQATQSLHEYLKLVFGARFKGFPTDYNF